MNPTFLNVVRIAFVLFCIAFVLFCIAFGVDKFFQFLPTCSLTQYIPPSGMIVTGLIEIGLGMVLLFKKYELIVVRILTGLIIGGLILHLVTGSTDFSGAIVGSLMGVFLIVAYKKQNKAIK